MEYIAWDRLEEFINRAYDLLKKRVGTKSDELSSYIESKSKEIEAVKIAIANENAEDPQQEVSLGNLNTLCQVICHCSLSDQKFHDELFNVGTMTCVEFYQCSYFCKVMLLGSLDGDKMRRLEELVINEFMKSYFNFAQNYEKISDDDLLPYIDTNVENLQEVTPFDFYNKLCKIKKDEAVKLLQYLDTEKEKKDELSLFFIQRKKDRFIETSLVNHIDYTVPYYYIVLKDFIMNVRTASESNEEGNSSARNDYVDMLKKYAPYFNRSTKDSAKVQFTLYKSIQQGEWSGVPMDNWKAVYEKQVIDLFGMIKLHILVDKFSSDIVGPCETQDYIDHWPKAHQIYKAFCNGEEPQVEKTDDLDNFYRKYFDNTPKKKSQETGKDKVFTRVPDCFTVGISPTLGKEEILSLKKKRLEAIYKFLINEYQADPEKLHITETAYIDESKCSLEQFYYLMGLEKTKPTSSTQFYINWIADPKKYMLGFYRVLLSDKDKGSGKPVNSIAASKYFLWKGRTVRSFSENPDEDAEDRWRKQIDEIIKDIK